MFKSLTCGLAVAALSVTPALAEPVANPASKLSVGSSVRAGAPAKKGDKLAAPGAIIALVAAAAIVAGGVLIAVDDDSDSN